jgi:uncharacterized YkwD family protein
MIMNKVILSVAAAAALVVANPILNKAHAASNNPNVQEKVYAYQGTDVNQINRILADFYNKLAGDKNFAPYYTINQQPSQTKTTQTVHTMQPSQTTKPVVTKPVAAKPVTTKPVTTKPVTTTQTTSALSAYEQKVVDLTNQERSKNGLSALKVDLTLSKMGHEKSRDMSANGYFSHTSPTYGSPFDMMKKYGITYRSAGENIAMGQKTPEEVVNAWMNSAGHRANILNPNYNYIGVGYVSQGNYWTQEFIGK